MGISTSFGSLPYLWICKAFICGQQNQQYLMKVENYMSSSQAHVDSTKMVEFQQKLIFGLDCRSRKLRMFFDAIEDVILSLTPEHYSLVSVINPQKKQMVVYSLYNCQIYGSDLEEGSYPFQITLKENRTTTDLVFEQKAQRDDLLLNLQALQESLLSKTDEHQRIHSTFLKYFVEYNVDQDMHLEQKEINSMIDGLNIPLSLAHRKLQAIDEFKNEKRLNIENFKTFMMLMECDEELYPLFLKFANLHNDKQEPMLSKYLAPKMKVKDFQQFQKQEQGQVYFHLPPNKAMISFYEFCSFLTSNHYNLFFTPSQIDDSHPLTHYYMHSSHNTYLEGNQLTSDSNAQLYYKNLKNGVRCMELDIHDSSNGPIIKHGFTLTASILFDQAIKEISLFSTKYPNHTPIFLSFENHCGQQNQDKMVISLQKHLKNKLYLIPLGRKTNQHSFPTMKELKGRIIIQGTGNIRKIYQDLIFIEESGEQKVLQMMFSKAETKSKKPEKKIKNLQQQIEKMDDVKEVTNQKLSHYFSVLVQPKWEVGDSCWQMANIAQNKFENMIQEEEAVEKLQKYSQKSFIRVYPFGLRFGSSNYNPLPMMRCGAQLISLNTQHYDANYTAVKAHFMQNYNCGYELKRKQLLGRNENKLAKLSKVRIQFINISSLVPEIISHSQDSTNLKLSFLGIDEDMEINENITKQIISSQPFYCRSFYVKLMKQGKKDKFPQITVQCKSIQQATVIVEIPKCGATGIPLKILRAGYRCLPLYDIKQSLKVMGNILIHTTFY